MADALLPLAVVVTALACAYVVFHMAVDWVCDRYSQITWPHYTCSCGAAKLDEGLISLTFSGTTHTATVCHPEIS